MAYLLMIAAEDGYHYSVYETAEAAQEGLDKQVGRKIEGLEGTVIDDWGRRLTVESRPDGWTIDKERAYADAFDFREMGMGLSPAQVAILAEMEG